MRSPGRYVDADGIEGETDLVFGGEWEPPSTVVKKWPPEWPLPRFLHEPTRSEPDATGYRQNTDPWVFGEHFRFSNCKQLTPKENPSACQRLTSGGGDAPLTLYGGATRSEPVSGMYSFVPCRRADSGLMRFARPVIELPGYVNPASKQSPSGALEPRPIEQARRQWLSVWEQVLSSGCLLAVSFPTPERSDGQ